MRRPTPTALRSVLYGALGAIVGLVVGIAVVGRFDDPAWFEAAGVWAGAAATVGAIVWAVNSFTWEQAEARRQDERNRREAEAQRLVVARLIISRVVGGGCQGGDGNWEMRDIALEVINTTSALNVTDLEVSIPAYPKVSRRLDVLKAGDTYRTADNLDPFLRVTDAQALRGDPLGVDALVLYTVDGRRWRRLGDADPEPLTSV